MNNKMIFGQYYNTSSWIHNLDPRTKLICLFALMISTFILSKIYFLLGMFGFVIILILSSRIPITKFLQSLRMMAFLLIFTITFQILFNQNGKMINELSYDYSLTILNLSIIILLFVIFFFLGKLTKKFRILTFILIVFISLYLQHILQTSLVLFNYRINVYDEGLFSALTVLLRIINLISLSSLLTLTTKPTDLNNGLESLAKPLKYIGVKSVSIYTMMISIALRFIPTLINEANRILRAQASRGVDFKEGKMKDKIKQIVSLLIPMFVIAYRRADDLADAMEARGYIPGAERTNINVLKYKLSDILTFMFSLMLFGSSIFVAIAL